METIFDHNPTPEELLSLFGYVVNQEAYLAAPKDQQAEYARIYSLYSERHDTSTAAVYLTRIQDPAFRRDISTDDLLG